MPNPTAKLALPPAAVECHLNIEVVPKQADRSRVVLMPGGRSYVQHYQPKEVVANGRAIAFLAAAHRPERPFSGAIRAELAFDFPWLASHSVKVRAQGRIPKDTKPDVDNLCKQVLDALATVSWFINDSRIQQIQLSKWYADKACVHIRMEAV